MSKLETWLQLAPEFGGERLGPFEGPTIRIGSADDADLQVHRDLGISAEHALLLKKPDGTHILSPVDRASAVFVIRGSESIPRLVRNPVVLRPGDRLVLGRPEGPAFDLVLAPAPRRTRGAATDPSESKVQATARRTGRAIASEVYRRGRSLAVTWGPGAWLQQTYYFLRSGQLFSGVYLVTGLMMLAGIGSSMRCSQLSTSLSNTQQSYATCQSELAAEGQDVDCKTLPNLDRLTANVLGHNGWEEALQWGQLRPAYLTALHALREDLAAQPNPTLLQRYVQRSATVAGAARELNSDVPGLLRVVPYLAVWPPPRELEGWSSRADPLQLDGPRHCARGPLAISWRQATHLGLAADPALYWLPEDRVAAFQGTRREAIWSKVEATALTTRVPDALGTHGPNDLLLTVDHVALTGSERSPLCKPLPFSDAGTDQRTQLRELGHTLRVQLQRNRADLPPYSAGTSLVGRLAWWEATDLRGSDLDALNLGSGNLDLAFRATEGLSAAQPLLEQRVAATMARAVLIPCMAALTPGSGDWPENLGTPPDPLACAFLWGGLEHDAL